MHALIPSRNSVEFIMCGKAVNVQYMRSGRFPICNKLDKLRSDKSALIRRPYANQLIWLALTVVTLAEAAMPYPVKEQESLQTSHEPKCPPRPSREISFATHYEGLHENHGGVFVQARIKSPRLQHCFGQIKSLVQEE